MLEAPAVHNQLRGRDAMPSRASIATCVGVVVYTGFVGLPESTGRAGPERPAAVETQEAQSRELPKTFTTPNKVNATVVSSSAGRVTINATAASGVTSTITITGDKSTVMERSMVEVLIDAGISLLEKWVGGGGGGPKGSKCTQTISTTTTGGSSTVTIKTECTTQQ
jgi:hypothetical protein